MIEATSWIWFAGGLLAGFTHATMLWQHVHRPSAWSPLFGLLRLGVVATLLIVAAISGAILACAAGWAVGFATLGTWFMTSRTGRTMDSSTTPPGEQRN